MILALLLACAELASAPPPPPKVVVIVTDTMRADLSGAEWPKWAEGGRRYTNAYSAAPWTSSSTVALATGRYPEEGDERLHPIGGELPCEPPRDWRPGPMLHSWPTDAWPDLVLTDQPVVARVHGDPVPHWEGPGSGALVEAAIDALDDGHRAIYVHTVGAHEPYDGLNDDRWQKPVKSSVSKAAGKHRRCGTMDVDHGAWMRLQYRSAAERVLYYLGPLVTAARASGAVVIWTSDHGEALGEDGLWGHATSLHDAQVRVPLIVWGPGVEPYVDDRPIPATCVGQTARVVLGDTTPGLCDLRTGDITGGPPVSGMMEGGTWEERVILAPVGAP